MATLTIYDLDPDVEAALRRRAGQKGHSVEREARDILMGITPAPTDDSVDLAEAIRRRFSPLGGVDDLIAPPRQHAPDPPIFQP